MELMKEGKSLWSTKVLYNYQNFYSLNLRIQLRRGCKPKMKYKLWECKRKVQYLNSELWTAISELLTTVSENFHARIAKRIQIIHCHLNSYLFCSFCRWENPIATYRRTAKHIFQFFSENLLYIYCVDMWEPVEN